MFHFPIDRRGEIKTFRFSSPGYPCLYLSESIYGCWEEMKRPLFHTCGVSRFTNEKVLNLIDLTLPTPQNLSDVRCLKRIPLIIACLIPVSNYSHVYKPEYLIPQMLIEWILKQRKNKPKKHTIIDGIRYLSSHYNAEFSFPIDKSVNYAFPAFNVENKYKYCKELCEIFSLTSPTTYDIQKLKGLTRLKYLKSKIYKEQLNQEEERYRDSKFYILEEILKSNELFPLEQIAPKE